MCIYLIFSQQRPLLLIILRVPHFDTFHVPPQAIYPNAPQLLLSDSSSSSNATVSSSEVKKAYMKAARALHPDKVQAGSAGPDGSVVTPQVAAKAAVLFTALAALYEDYKAKADT